MMQAFADPEGADTANFTIQRPLEKVKDGLTFSQDVVEQLKDDVFLFIGGRICAFQDGTGKPAQKVTVKVIVEVETLV